MANLSLNLLGTVEFTTAGSTPTNLQFRSDKIRALLIYLALEAGRPHQRRFLASLLWPDASDAVSLRNLRKGLFQLRQAIDRAAPNASDTLLQADRNTIQLAQSGITVDALQFEHLLLSVEQHSHRHLHLCQDCLERLVQATTLYQGELLTGFSLRDAATFEDWLLFWRERLHQRAISVFSQLTAAYMERGDHEQALTIATHLLALDRFREEAHRQVMRLLVLNGQHNRALAQYEACRQLLEDELGVEPAAETVALFEQIRAAQQGEDIAESSHPTVTLHHFPTQFTPFIGREKELLHIRELFLDPNCRLLTLVGPGGMGKSRLSIAVAESLADGGGFSDGIYFFPLAAVHDSDTLVMRLVSGLDVALSARMKPKDHLLDYLRHRHCLLVLDNFEQLVESAPLLADMLAAAPDLRLLVSSHIPLQLRAEKRLTVPGLDYPDEGDMYADASAYSAIRLFVESASYADASFQLNPENEQAIIQICQFVQGVPLALELAASWVNVLSCAEIAREIGRNANLLSRTLRDKPSRHQGMAAVFDYSYALLEETEQVVLGQLTVFPSSFDLEAATAITDATPLTLARLLDRSLLQRKKDGRFALHPMLHQFVTQKIGEQDRQVSQQHSTYFLNFVVSQEDAFNGALPRQAIAAVHAELDNVRQAWRWAVEQGDVSLINRSLEGLARFYHVATLFQEGENAIRIARQAQQVTGTETQFQLQEWHAYFVHLLGDQSEATQLAQAALELAGQDAARQARAHNLLGRILPAVGKTKEAIAYLEQAIGYYRKSADLKNLARALQRMVLACLRGGEHDEMLRYAQEAIPLHQALERKQGLAQLNNVMAGFYFERGDMAQALAHIEQAQQLYEAIDSKLDAAVVAANLGSLYSSLGQFEDALASNQRAIDISQEMGNRPNLSRDLSNRGAILATIGEFERSLDYYFRAIEIEKALGNESRVAYFQAGIASVYQTKGDTATAQIYYDLALPVLLKQANPYHVVGPLLGKAELLLQQGEWALARALNEQAFTLAAGTHLAEYSQQSRILTAKLDYAVGDQSAAQEQLVALLDATKDEAERAALYYELWQMTQDSAAREKALAAYRQLSKRVPSFINQRRFSELK